MKRILFIVVLVFTVSVASAWNRRADEGVVVLATKHLSPAAKSVVDRYLGESYYDDTHYFLLLNKQQRAQYSSEIRYLHLDKELNPTKVENDALTAIEQSLAIVRARDSYPKGEVTKALRIIIHLMCDIHNFSRIRIEGVPQSQANFKLPVYVGDYGSRKKLSKVSWVNFWTSYSNWHMGFSGDLWAEDMELCLGSRREELSQGDLQSWVAQIGAEAAKLYARINPEYVMTRRERNELEELNYEMMARAGYRLAVLLNEAVK